MKIEYEAKQPITKVGRTGRNLGDHCFMKRPFLDAGTQQMLNTAMKQYKATVRVAGLIMTTVVFAENTNFAMKLLQAQFGTNNVVGIPTPI